MTTGLCDASLVTQQTKTSAHPVSIPALCALSSLYMFIRVSSGCDKSRLRLVANRKDCPDSRGAAVLTGYE